MNENPHVAAWHQANDAYLGAAVEWLRLLLARYATAPGAPSPIVAEEQRATPRGESPPQGGATPWWSFRRGAPSGTPPPPEPRAPLALPPASFEVSQGQVDEAAARMRAVESIEPAPALSHLAYRLGLTRFERNVLLLCIANELDTRIGPLCARVHNDPALAFPTFGLAFAIFGGEGVPREDRPHWDARSTNRPLRYWRLVEINTVWSMPLTTSALRADEWTVNFAKGLTDLDDRIASFITHFELTVDVDELQPSQRGVVDQVTRTILQARPEVRPVQLIGSDAEGKELVALAAANDLGIVLHRLQADLLPTQAADLETLARLWRRMTRLGPYGLYVDAHDVDRAADHHATALKRFLARIEGVIFIAGGDGSVPSGTPSFEVRKPEAAEQRSLWREMLGEEHEHDAANLAAQFNVSASTIARVAAETRNEAGDEPLIDRVWGRVTAETRMHIDSLAQRIDARATWEDLVLPEPETELLHQIAAHVTERAKVYDEWGFRERMTRGLGTSALFAGESGTGKTMAAEVIANELGVSLHRIDLSAVISKWVGETQKNLQQLFNAADDSNGILFFDEADALFGKRAEVQHSQDRWANLEINYLLQRFETYRGLAILATNLKSALDTAFLRRLRFIVNFPFPGPAERKRIWERAFPGGIDTSELDFDWLSRLSITGASAQNVALAAAFLAAKRRTVVTMPIVLEAARTEMRKLEKPINEADLKWNVGARGGATVTPGDFAGARR